MKNKSIFKTAIVESFQLIKNYKIIFLICIGFLVLALELEKISLFIIVCLIAGCMINRH